MAALNQCVVPLRDRHGHPDIVISYRDMVAALVDTLQTYFAEAVAGGTAFRAEQTVQVGWMLLKLREGEGGQLVVWEPGFHAMPIEWVLGASNTLRYLLMQREVCDRLGVEPAFPTIVQPAVIPSAFLQGGGHFTMERDQPEAGHSGWTFRGHGVLDRWNRTTRLCSLFEIALHRPAVIPFLALPGGSSVRRESDSKAFSAARELARPRPTRSCAACSMPKRSTEVSQQSIFQLFI